MKKLLLIVLAAACSHAFAQDSLRTFNRLRNGTTTTGMEVLGSWAIANIGVGAVGWANSKGGANKYFYQMTAIWGGANLGAAVLGFTGSRKDKKRQHSAAETLEQQKKIEKIFVVNGGLDIVYIGTGLYLKNRGDNHNSDELRGYGSSVIIQGVFLLLFDGTMYHAEKHNGNKLMRFFEKNPVTFNGNKVGLIYHLN